MIPAYKLCHTPSTPRDSNPLASPQHPLPLQPHTQFSPSPSQPNQAQDAHALSQPPSPLMSHTAPENDVITQVDNLTEQRTAEAESGGGR